MRRAILLAALAVVSCAAPGPRVAPPSEAAVLPVAPYRAALGTHGVYRVAGGHSRVDIIVRRGGKLQRFGHDHVITARDVAGYALMSEGDGSRADLLVDLRGLQVDEAAAREIYGLESEPSESDVAGTADNMHQRVLETESWPNAQIAVNVRQWEGDWARCDVTLTLKGSSQTFPLHVLVDYDDAHFNAQGMFTLRQTDYGIEPFSLLGGSLSVRDRLDVHFRITGESVDEIEP